MSTNKRRNMDEDDDGAPHMAAVAPKDVRQLARQLFDLQMRQIVTTRMLPLIYGSALVLAGLLTAYFIGWGFKQSWWLGILWVVVIGPALFLAVVMTVRVFLEFVLTVFRIAFFLESLGGQIDSIAGQTDEIARDLPRIQFWRRGKGRD